MKWNFRPEYKKEHAWLFKDGNMEGPDIAISQECYESQVYMRPFYSTGLKKKKGWADETLKWAVEIILMQLSIEASSVFDSCRVRS